MKKNKYLISILRHKKIPYLTLCIAKCNSIKVESKKDLTKEIDRLFNDDNVESISITK